MVAIKCDEGHVKVVLSVSEKVGALTGNISIQVSDIKDVYVSQQASEELRGMRVGTGIPGVIRLGRFLHNNTADFGAVYMSRPGVVIQLKPGARYDRVVLCTGDPEADVELVRKAMSS